MSNTILVLIVWVFGVGGILMLGVSVVVFLVVITGSAMLLNQRYLYEAVVGWLFLTSSSLSRINDVRMHFRNITHTCDWAPSSATIRPSTSLSSMSTTARLHSLFPFVSATITLLIELDV